VRSLLHPGARFQGFLKYKQDAYEAEVKLQNVQLEQSYLNGTLTVKRSRDEQDVIFFNGELISARHPFLTRKWEADEEVDRKHWGKFQSFYNKIKTFNDDNFQYEAYSERQEYVYMRWKEQYVVSSEGSRPAKYNSVDGFYYVELHRSHSCITAHYYHRTQEQNCTQSLTLTHVPDPCVQVYEVR